MSKHAPNFLQPLSSDEYLPLPFRPTDFRAVERTSDGLYRADREFGPQIPSRLRTASGLRAINAEAAETFFEVPVEATIEQAAAEEAFLAKSAVIDVQTHFLAPRAIDSCASNLEKMYRAIMPDWWNELDDLTTLTLDDYVQNVFLEAETTVAILTSGPGLGNDRHLFNEEMWATRALIDRLAGTGRLLNHCVVHADRPEELDAMEYWRDRFCPAGWKVYTPGRVNIDSEGSVAFDHGWMLDDEEFGLPFLERVRQVGVPLICAHKGISASVNNGSPRDIGPAAKAFPDLSFLVYHSGYELPWTSPSEGAFVEGAEAFGVDRLIQSALEQGIGSGGNIYAELGTTWFSLIRRPLEAAHVLGKLIAHFGEENVIWGSDSAWYGSPQPLVDAFRVFQIPDWMCERYGYAKITDRTRSLVLGGNAARVYGIDLPAVQKRAVDDSLGWARQMLQDMGKAR